MKNKAIPHPPLQRIQNVEKIRPLHYELQHSRVKQDHKEVQQQKRKEISILTGVIREDSIKEVAFEPNLKRWAGFKLEMKEGRVLHAEGRAQANARMGKKVGVSD